jgi:alternate signal-mediated exported protein
MNKLVKGSIAGAAGIALLLGGAGTFALWNDSTTVAAAPITTGQLGIVAATTPAATWTDTSTGAILNGTAIAEGTQKMVPGDSWTYTKRFVLTTEGKNLLADLVLDPSTLVVGTVPAAEVTSSFSATAVAATGAALLTNPTGSLTTYRVTPGTATTTSVDVKVVVNYLNKTTGTGNDLAGRSSGIALGAVKVELRQVRP